MKKLIFLVFLIIPFMGWSQTDSVIYFFGKILNKYREDSGLNKLTIHNGLKGFSDSHVKYMSDNGILTHNKLQERINQFFPNQTTRFFKDTLLPLPTENNARTAILLPYNRMKVNDPKILKLISDMNLKYIDNSLSFNLAVTIFYQWMNSPGHNEVLKHPMATKFYLSYVIKKWSDKRILQNGIIFNTNGERCYSEYVTM